MFQKFMKDQYQRDEQFDMELQYSKLDMEKAFNAGRASSEYDRQFAMNTAGQLQKALINLMAEHAELQKRNTDDEKDKWLFKQYAGQALQGQISNMGDLLITVESAEYMATDAITVATILLNKVKQHESI